MSQKVSLKMATQSEQSPIGLFAFLAWQKVSALDEAFSSDGT